MNINKAIIVGRLTQDLELKSLTSGTKVLNFSVATNYVYKDVQGNKVENTEFHNVVTFGKQAEIIAQYFTKGQEIYVEGRLQTRSWEDKETGKKLYRTEIILEKFDFGSRPSGNSSNFNNNENNIQKNQNQNQNQKPDSEIKYPEENIDPKDIPF